MKKYYIVQLNQVGNIGPHEIKKVKDQPEKGFETEQSAEDHLIGLIESKKYPFDMWFNWTVLKLYSAL